ncbi:hypothetical protein PGT21_000272 [Puccinia graminis f. sp. tritici]|uniref:Uncharacterized protein n=1 Tax=Puccinia graminis f. sp. tritici TaxID=56615 RepID=A0A5B0M8A7_PUCGR|nr:hypothetical protein PGT21_000272 [Puccinia graminis f. sp. tritici]
MSLINLTTPGPLGGLTTCPGALGGTVLRPRPAPFLDPSAPHSAPALLRLGSRHLVDSPVITHSPVNRSHLTVHMAHDTSNAVFPSLRSVASRSWVPFSLPEDIPSSISEAT